MFLVLFPWDFLCGGEPAMLTRVEFSFNKGISHSAIVMTNISIMASNFSARRLPDLQQSYAC